MTAKTVDVFGVGQCSLDVIGRIDSYPSADVKCEFTGMVIQGGGPVATALTALSRWGLTCSFAGIVGDDLFGGMIEGSLAGEGIRTEGLIRRRGERSQFAFITAEAGTGRRTIFWQRPTGPALAPEEIDADGIRSSRILHTDGLFIDAALFASSAARKAGVPVSVDAGTLRDGMIDLARQSDYFIASREFARQLTGGDDPREGCRRIAEEGPRLAGVTLGSDGYAALYEGTYVRKPAHAATAVDTTGCGDVFHAGFIFGVINRWGYERSLDFAAWSAAMVSRHPGGRTGIPTMEDISVFRSLTGTVTHEGPPPSGHDDKG